jgi:hypothetical protein
MRFIKISPKIELSCESGADEASRSAFLLILFLFFHKNQAPDAAETTEKNARFRLWRPFICYFSSILRRFPVLTRRRFLDFLRKPAFFTILPRRRLRRNAGKFCRIGVFFRDFR